MRSIVYFLALLLACTVCSMVQATPVGGGSGSSMETSHDMQSGGYEWIIGGGSPVDVSLDPNAGPWIKHLNGLPGQQGFSADDTGYTAPVSFHLVEHLVIGGTLNWADWHEEIVTAGWIWGSAFFDIPINPAPGYNVNYTDQVWPLHGGAVDMTFDPLAPGTQVTITKDLIWVGDPNVIGNLFFGTVTIREWPTPEPATAMLLVIGALAMPRRRRS